MGVTVLTPRGGSEALPLDTMVDLVADDTERKQVTVLFADVKGSMDLAEQHDPEDWHRIMQRFFSTLAEAVTRFEGTVDKFTGDGIMAVFGAPVAHEDHARRACYAAQQMEALAEPGRAYLTESTAELARGYLDLRDLGEFEIKGASRPVQVFELAGVGAARSRLDLARERGFSSFVGRETELSRLDDALARAEAGEASAVGVVAEPGIGKSRL